MKAAICASSDSGDWSSSSTWSCGRVPTCGDSIVISSGHTVTVNSNQDLTSCTNPIAVAIYGIIKFDNGRKLYLPNNSRLYIFPSASIVPGSGGGNSNLIEIGGTSVWSTSSGILNGPGCLPPTLPGCGTVLPIELVSFNVNSCNSHACLTWETLTEHNNNYFELQQLLADGTSIVRTLVPSLGFGGNSNKLLKYSWIDENEHDEIIYYRLKQIDFDGSYSYSNIIHYEPGNNVETFFSIYPNPNKGSFYLKLSSDFSSKPLNVSIYNISGVKINETRFVQNSGDEPTLIKTKISLPKGYYLCVIFDGFESHKLKFLVD